MNIQDKLLTVNPFSRPNIKIGNIKKIVVHYVGNPGSSATGNRNYFEKLKNQDSNGIRYASSHYIVGLEGEVVRCVPETEVAYHASVANSYSIGIECCHPFSDGKFSSKTLESLYVLLSELCKKYNLDPFKDIIRHYDVTGKNCPIYYVSNFKEWENIKKEVFKKMNDKKENEVPNWQIEAMENFIKKFNLDRELWLSKANNPITVSEMFSVLNKIL